MLDNRIKERKKGKGLGNHRVGQTNVEAPARLIRDMVREGIREELVICRLAVDK